MAAPARAGAASAPADYRVRARHREWLRSSQPGDLLEIFEDRYGTRSTVITSQVPPTKCHDHLGDATMADAICDRVLHNAHRIVLKGPSRRKEDSAATKL